MIIDKINTAQFGPEGEVIFDLNAREAVNSPVEKITYVYREDDPYSGQIGAYFKDWLVANISSISAYVAPTAPTIDEIRADMPMLTARQFWIAAAHIDIDKDVLTATIKVNIGDSIERKMMLAELETSTFERLNPTVVDLMALLSIPAEQVDDLWVWAADI